MQDVPRSWILSVGAEGEQYIPPPQRVVGVRGGLSWSDAAEGEGEQPAPLLMMRHREDEEKHIDGQGDVKSAFFAQPWPASKRHQCLQQQQGKQQQTREQHRRDLVLHSSSVLGSTVDGDGGGRCSKGVKEKNVTDTSAWLSDYAKFKTRGTEVKHVRALTKPVGGKDAVSALSDDEEGCRWEDQGGGSGGGAEEGAGARSEGEPMREPNLKQTKSPKQRLPVTTLQVFDEALGTKITSCRTKILALGTQIPVFA